MTKYFGYDRVLPMNTGYVACFINDFHIYAHNPFTKSLCHARLVLRAEKQPLNLRGDGDMMLRVFLQIRPESFLLGTIVSVRYY